MAYNVRDDGNRRRRLKEWVGDACHNFICGRWVPVGWVMDGTRAGAIRTLHCISPFSLSQMTSGWKMTFFWEPGGVKLQGKGTVWSAPWNDFCFSCWKLNFAETRWIVPLPVPSYLPMILNDWNLIIINYYRHFAWYNTQNCFQKGCVLYISGVKSRNSGPKFHRREVADLGFEPGFKDFEDLFLSMTL